MITLDQIRKLDEKIQSAVSVIVSLREENKTLNSKLDDYQNRIADLEVSIEKFSQDQGEIESGILKALEHLELVEDGLSNSETVDSPAAEPDDTQDSEESELDIF